MAGFKIGSVPWETTERVVRQQLLSLLYWRCRSGRGLDKSSLGELKRCLSASSHEKSSRHRWSICHQPAKWTRKGLQSSAAFSLGCEGRECLAEIGSLLSSAPTLSDKRQTWTTVLFSLLLTLSKGLFVSVMTAYYRGFIIYA